MTRDADALGKSGHGTSSPSLPTPGPWYVSVAKLICAPHETFEARVVADLSPSSCAVNRDANARLIAAAPDLLAALTACVEWQARVFDSESPCWDAARAVIAKATGTEVR